MNGEQIMNLKAIAFLYSYQCNFFCAHCSVGASPKLTDTLPIDMIKKVIDEAYLIPSFQVIVFTGGEPTLHPEHLRFGINYAYRRGFIVRLVTNAWWARTYDRAYQFLKELRDLGLRELNVSVDDFHIKYLNAFGGLNNVVNAVKAGVDLELNVAVGTTKVLDSDITTQRLRDLFSRLGLEDKVFFLEDLIAPLNRASQLRDLLLKNPPWLKPNIGCAHVGDEISVHPDGRVTFCCGHGITLRETEWFFTVGNVYRDSLRDIVNRIRRNALLWYLFLRGPQTLVWKFNPNEELTHQCEACYLLATKYKDQVVKLIPKKRELLERLLSGKDIDDLISGSNEASG